MRRLGINLLIFSALLFTTTIKICAAYVTQPLSVILLVGLTGDELADHEKNILQGKKTIEIPVTDTWQKTINTVQADEVILKQSTGFVGLYTPGGYLIRPLETVEGNPYFQNNPDPITAQKVGTDTEFTRYGYSTGGRIDPYQPRVAYQEPRDNAKLAPGYGYNSHIEQPRVIKRTIIGDLFNFVPVDVVTPFNYPGTYDQLNVSAAYGLGVIPHIGGAIVAARRAQADKTNYDYYKTQYPPSHADTTPIYDYYNKAEPDNPISSDPNFMRMDPMPQAFQRDYPNYGASTH